MFSKSLKQRDGVVNTQLVTPELVRLVVNGQANSGTRIETASIGNEEAPEYYECYNRAEE